MAWAHNAMLRGLNAIYLQAPYISSEDARNFQFFIAAWAEWVLHYHKIEESEMFPAFQSVPGVARGSLEHNIQQHHEFSGGLSALHMYAKEKSSANYSGVHVQSLIDGFAETLRQHFADEIDTLWAMDSVTSRIEHSAKLLGIYEHCEKEAGKQDKRVVPSMVLGLCDKTFEEGNDWPKMPMGSAYFVHYVFGRKYRGAWRFLPCDTWGNPKPLQFLGGGNQTG